MSTGLRKVFGLLAQLAIFVLTGLAAVSVQPRAPEETPFSIPTAIIQEFGQAQIRAQRDDVEELFCVIGQNVEAGIRAHGAMKPDQETWVDRTPTGTIYAWHVKAINPLRCPPNSVADFHTHPGRWRPTVMDPSAKDIDSWEGDKYNLHMIGWMRPDGWVMISFYVRDQDGEFQIYDADQVTQY